MAALHDGPCRQPRLAAAFAAGQDAWPRGDAERFADFPATGAEETAGPLSHFKIAGARRVVREKPLELGRGFGNASPASARCLIRLTTDNYLFLAHPIHLGL